MQSCLEPLGQHCIGFLSAQCCPKSIKTTCCVELFGQHCIEFRPVQFCPKSIKAKLHTIFFMQCCLKPLIAWGFYLCNVVSKVLGQHLTKIHELNTLIGFSNDF